MRGRTVLLVWIGILTICVGIWFGLGLLASKAFGSVDCNNGGTINPMAEFKCSRTVVATTEPYTFRALGRGWNWLASRLVAYNRDFMGSMPVRRCHMYGRAGAVRFKETFCDGRLTVTIRSIGPDVPVTYEWEAWR